MKVFAIGRNYVAHIEELQNQIPTDPVVFMKPETAVLRNNEPFYYPDFSKSIDYEVEIVLLVGKEGKNIEPKFASRYYDSIGLGIDFTARDLQTELKSKQLPWEISKSFNGSAPVSYFKPKEDFKNIQNIEFSLFVNDKLCQKGNSSNMIFNFDTIISYLSKFFTLKKGDMIFTGTPAGIGSVAVSDNLKGYIGQDLMFNFDIK